MLAALAALVLAATAWADSGTSTAPENGGTSAGKPASVEKSGGVAGPPQEKKKPARAAQTTTPEEPPQIETTPTETTPSTTVPQQTPTPTGTTTTPSAVAPSTSSGSGGGGFLPHTGLELVALSAVGLGLLLAGLTLRRWRET
jgi:LPXTG-motif cell wall-anchored protein